MKQPKGFVGEFGEEIKETVKKGKEELGLGQAFEEFLRALFGGAKPLSPEQEKKLEEKKEAEKRKVRAQVLEEFMPTQEEERVYYRKQKEEVLKKIGKQKEGQKKAWEATSESPKGAKKRGSLFEFLRRKVTSTERKSGGKF